MAQCKSAVAAASFLASGGGCGSGSNLNGHSKTQDSAQRPDGPPGLQLDMLLSDPRALRDCLFPPASQLVGALGPAGTTEGLRGRLVAWPEQQAQPVRGLATPAPSFDDQHDHTTGQEGREPACRERAIPSEVTQDSVGCFVSFLAPFSEATVC